MLLYDPGGTPLDLRFRLFETNVRVHPMFWLIMLMLGWPRSANVPPADGLREALIFVLCAFVSILLHEFGHVWMGRVFGSHGHILLHGMGGLAIGSADVPSRWQRILVSAAGPGIQLLLYAVLYFGLIRSGLLEDWLGPKPPEGWSLTQLILLTILSQMLWINWWWPLLNLLPVWPLDGGWITREFFQIVAPRQGLLASLWVSLVVAGALAANALFVYAQGRELVPYVGRYFGGIFMGIFFAMFAMGSFQAIQEERRQRRRYWEDDDELPWERR